MPTPDGWTPNATWEIPLASDPTRTAGLRVQVVTDRVSIILGNGQRIEVAASEVTHD